MARREWLALGVLLGCVLPVAAAPEKWADPALKATGGLLLWLDASRQRDGWQAHGKPALVTGARLDVCYDASGNGIHLAQRGTAAQPRFVSTDGNAVIRFNGQDNYLEWLGPKREVEAFTLFLVAAPRSNVGLFRGFFAANEIGKNDYTTGFTLDQHGVGSGRFELLNVEGRGFGEAMNLMKAPLSFGDFHTLTVHCQPGVSGVRLAIDGVAAGTRERKAGVLRLDQLTLGARCYSNTADPPFVSGFLDGDIAEVLLFDRVLSAEETKAVQAYLDRKHAGLAQAIGASSATEGRLVKAVTNPPAVQVFAPGFAVRQLPVDLPNINNVRYRADGKLLALGYDGNLYLLSDSDGDGLEDKVELFWDSKGQLRAPIGMALTPPRYKHGDGAFVACKGKVVLIVDTDGDGKADKEIVVAKGWQELSHGVDALGVAIDKDGGVYFGLGSTDYTNAYLLRDGTAKFDLKGERGTILKVAPDFSRREILATGIRFPVGLAFNRHGDLFATDQEGATWLPNGNPFDELLHIQRGRHYGFPPRHPKHLPDVLDEPSVFDYAPQHQSTCGLVFNEAVNGGPVFGPAHWQSDALVAGYSRGKLYRTKLARTEAGYVARNEILASLGMLGVDACVSPQGDLVVAVHSGAPDWGSGPTGKGKLYKLHMQDREMPQPVLAWAAGPREVRVAFDRPLDPAWLSALGKQPAIEFGKYVGTGDRFEVLRPGYAAVQQQMATPRFDLTVQSVQVSSDRRTLILATAPHLEAVPHALTLTDPSRAGKKDGKGELPQHAAIDLGYDLTGVEATWQARGGAANWTGWLPHPDLAVSRVLTAGSAEHALLWPLLDKPGQLVLRTQLDLWQMLRPAVQPGSTLDHTPPPEKVTVVFRSRQPLVVKATGHTATTEARDGYHEARLTLTPREREWTAVEIALPTDGPPLLEVTFTTAEDERPRAMPLRRFLLPWASAKRQSAEVALRLPAELQGGNWLRGREVFFSEEAKCAKCHLMRGQGGKIGPDLSNLMHRDYLSVLRDIRQPSVAINPDYLSYVVELKNGKVLTGVVRDVGERILLGDDQGREFLIPRTQIDSFAASPISTMPEGLDKAIGADRLRDLLTFLLTEPLGPATLELPNPPPPRTRTEVDAVLKDGKPLAKPLPKLHIVMAAGPKDHGPGEHDYPLWQRRWVKLFDLAENVLVSTADGWPTPQQWAKADVIVFYSNNPGWTDARAKDLDDFLARGGGLTYIHYAVDGHRHVEAFAERIGLAWQGGTSKFRHGPLELSFPDTKHPITRGFDKVKFVDESYWNLRGDPKRVQTLATGVEEDAPRPLLWTREQGKGRVFVSIPGHYSWTFDDPLFRELLLRGIAWSAGEPVERFESLVLEGARVQPEKQK